MPTPLVDRAGLTDERRAALAAEVAGQASLGEVVRAALAAGRDVAEVIVQDEFTHDVVIGGPDGLWLVYDTT